MNPKKTQVTIGIPVYNAESTISACIKSVLDQSYVAYKLIIYDNASTDNTRLISETAIGEDDRVTYTCHDQNLGPAENFRLLYTASDSRYFMWLASDDVIEPEFLSDCVAVLETDDSVGAVSFCPLDSPSQKSIDQGYIGYMESFSDERIDAFLRSLPDGNSRFYGLYRREILQGFDFAYFELFAGDWILIKHVLQQAKLSLQYRRGSGYIKNPGGLSESGENLSTFSMMKSINPYKDFIASVPQSLRKRRRGRLLLMSALMTYSIVRSWFRNKKTEINNPY